MSRRDSLLAALVATIWGFNFVVIDWGMDGVPPLVFVAVRFAAVVLPAIFLVRAPSAPWRTVAAVGRVHVAGAVRLPLRRHGRRADAGAGRAGAAGAGDLHDRDRGRRAARAPDPGAGRGRGRRGGRPGRGRARPRRRRDRRWRWRCACSAALSWGIGNVVSRSAGVVGGLSITVWSAVVVPVPVLLLSLVVDGPHAVAAGFAAFGWQAALSTLYTAGLASLVGYAVFNSLLARNESAYVVPWVLLAPVVAMTSAWLLLDQRPSARGEHRRCAAGAGRAGGHAQPPGAGRTPRGARTGRR